MEKLEHLREELNTLIDEFRTESEKHKRLSRRLKYVLFALTGSATVLSATAVKFMELQVPLNLLVVVVTCGASIVTSVEALRKPAELWIIERGVLHALKDLQRELEYEASANPHLDVDPFFDRLQSVMAASKEQWTKQVGRQQKAV